MIISVIFAMTISWGCQGDPNVFIEDLKHEKKDVRLKAINTLVMMKNYNANAVTPFIVVLRDDRDTEVRSSAAIALGMIKANRAIAPLIAALKDKDLDVRNAAAWSLGAIKAKPAIEPLIVAVKEKRIDIQRAASLSLKEITGQNFNEDIMKWESWLTTNQKTATTNR